MISPTVKSRNNGFQGTDYRHFLLLPIFKFKERPIRGTKEMYLLFHFEIELRVVRDVAREAETGLRESDVWDLRVFDLRERSFNNGGFRQPTEALLHDGDVVFARQDVGRLTGRWKSNTDIDLDEIGFTFPITAWRQGSFTSFRQNQDTVIL